MVAQKNIILAITTSIQDSGLLDMRTHLFEKKTSYMVKTTAIGSGQAMAMGERGEVDVCCWRIPRMRGKRGLTEALWI